MPYSKPKTCPAGRALGWLVDLRFCLRRTGSGAGRTWKDHATDFAARTVFLLYRHHDARSRLSRAALLRPYRLNAMRECLQHTNFNMLRNHVVGKADSFDRTERPPQSRERAPQKLMLLTEGQTARHD